MKMRRRLLTSLLLLVFLPLAASAQIVFAFNFNDAANTGFNDATSLGTDRRNALQSAANTLGSYFSSSYTATVTFNVTSHSTDNGTLASAGSGYSGLGSSGFYRTDVQKMIQSGLGTGTGTINWNFFHDWDYDDSVSGGSFDFKAVAMHEVLHAMGFAGLIKSTGQGGFNNASGTPDVWATFDQFLTNSAGGRLVNTSAEYVGSDILTNGIGSDVYFDGANAKAANGGNRVHIYSPATFESGSSLSHLDTDFFTSDDFVMEHAVAAGPATRTLSAIEIGILMDLGYTMAAIPEPATIALVFGAGALGLAAWRRRRIA
jgi:hypothetical protein